MEIDFHHYKFPFNTRDVRLNSNYYDLKTKKDILLESFNSTKKLHYKGVFTFPEKLMLLANEAFPESAINDPLGDLRVWDTWRTGGRSFPYPGVYLPLDIFNQETKIQSSSTIGVVGECLAGMFATAGIAPWPTVRVIRHWPDFIYYNGGSKSFALIESKAFTDFGDTTTNPNDRLNISTFREFLVAAFGHLLSDRSVSVWGAFTRVQCIEPFRAQVTFVETSLSGNSTNSNSPVVVEEFGQQMMRLALGYASGKLYEHANLDKKRHKIDDSEVQDMDMQELPKFVQREIKKIVEQPPFSVISTFSSSERDTIMHAAQDFYFGNKDKIFKAVKSAKTSSGDKKLPISQEEFEEIRIVGDTRILGKMISLDTAKKIDTDWTSDWGNVGDTRHTESDEIFRFGGLLLKAETV